MPANLEDLAVATGLEKLLFIPIPKKGNAKECSNYHTIALISHASTAMLKILQARVQKYVNWELPDVQAGFRKGRETRDQIVNTHKTKVTTFGPNSSGQIDGETVTDFIFLGSKKSLQMVTAAMKWKDTCSLEEKQWPI